MRMNSRVRDLTLPAITGKYRYGMSDRNFGFAHILQNFARFSFFRLYHHTVTCLPIYPKEMDIDSEGENDPKWLQTKTMMMIDDFTDVNEGEKELMKMWNLHVMKYGYVGDCQIPLACQMFLENKGKELLMKNLYRNFVLHMCSLFDFGLVSPVILYQTIQKLQEIMKEGGEDGDVRKVLQKSHEAQMERWAATSSQSSTQDAPKTSGGSIKVNFSNDGSSSNARRKTSLPLGSPSSQNIKSTMSVHNNVSKHASMMAASSSSSSKAAVAHNNSSMQNSACKNSVGNSAFSSASSVQSITSKVAGSNTGPNAGQVMGNKTAMVASNGISNQSENATSNKHSGSDLPARRKSTNSIMQVNTESSTPLRRKSMASESVSTEYHRRKLVLDAIPSNGVASQKPSPNGGSYQ